MNTLFKKQIYIRLSKDGTRFFYTVKYGRFAAFTRQTRLVGKGNIPASADVPMSGVPVPLRIAPGRNRE